MASLSKSLVILTAAYGLSSVSKNGLRDVSKKFTVKQPIE